MSINYTIIIPHHNIPELLDRCLSSIPRRYDVQIIVVDDCSDKEYLPAIHEVEQKFPGVVFVYDKEGGGGGHARNVGLTFAQGKYIMFADADDFFNDCFNAILDDFIEAEEDLIFFKGNSVDTDTYLPAHRADHLNSYIDAYLKGGDKEGNLLRYKFGEPWARMVKSSVIFDNDILFDDTKIHNDTTYAYLVGYYGKTFRVDTRPLYCVTVRSGSVSARSDANKIKTRVAVFARAEQFYKAHNIPMEVTEHYVQLARLLAHRKFSLYNACCKIITDYGTPMSCVFVKTVKTFCSILMRRQLCGRKGRIL